MLVEPEPGCALVCDEAELLCGEESVFPLLCESGLELVPAGCKGVPASAAADGVEGAVCCGGNFVAEGAVGSCGCGAL